MSAILLAYTAFVEASGDIGPIDIRPYVDGTVNDAGPTNSPRADIAALYGQFGAQHGYKLSVRSATGSNFTLVRRANGDIVHSCLSHDTSGVCSQPGNTW